MNEQKPLEQKPATGKALKKKLPWEPVQEHEVNRKSFLPSEQAVSAPYRDPQLFVPFFVFLEWDGKCRNVELETLSSHKLSRRRMKSQTKAHPSSPGILLQQWLKVWNQASPKCAHSVFRRLHWGHGQVQPWTTKNWAGRRGKDASTQALWIQCPLTSLSEWCRPGFLHLSILWSE